MARRPNKDINVPSMQEMLQASLVGQQPEKPVDFVQSGINGLELQDTVLKRKQAQEDRVKSIQDKIQTELDKKKYERMAGAANPDIANEIGFIPKESAESILKSKLLAQSDEAKLARAQLAALKKGGAGAAKPNAGQEATDRAFGKDYNTYVAQGGTAGFATNLGKLDNSIKTLEDQAKGSTTTQMTQRAASVLPDSVRGFVTPDYKRAEQDARSNVLGLLRQTLGAQFTEKEGERIFSQTFDPTLPIEDNIARLKTLRESLATTASDKEAAIRHFEQHNGTLAGFQGKLPNITPGIDQNPAPTGNPGKKSGFRVISVRPSAGGQ